MKKTSKFLMIGFLLVWMLFFKIIDIQAQDNEVFSKDRKIANTQGFEESGKKPLVEEEKPKYVELDVVATAYCPCVKCCGKDDGITSTGVKAKANHTVAADPKVLPYGTEIVIGENTYVVEDCGGAIKGNRIDFFFDTHKEALQFGRQEVTIWIKEDTK
jgi:3D (Asp-Asp-Asp) domain-containing protein